MRKHDQHGKEPICHHCQERPQLVLYQVGWSFRVVFSWGRGLGLYTLAPVSHWMQLSLEGNRALGKAVFFPAEAMLEGD